MQWPGTVLDALQLGLHFILQTTLRDRSHYYDSHFRGEKTEARGQTLDMSHSAEKWDLNVISWVPAMPGLGGGWQIKDYLNSKGDVTLTTSRIPALLVCTLEWAQALILQMGRLRPSHQRQNLRDCLPIPCLSVLDTRAGTLERPLAPALGRSLDPPCHPTPPTLHPHGNHAGEPHHC